MSDIRLQNLLQYMKQTATDKNGGLVLSPINFSQNLSDLPEGLQNYITTHPTANQAALQVAFEGRVVEFPTSNQVSIAFGGEIFTVPIPNDAQNFVANASAGDKVVLVLDQKGGENVVIAKTANSSAETRQAPAVNEGQAVATADVPKAITPVEQKHYERVAKLEAIEQKIDALLKVIPGNREPLVSVLRSHVVQLDSSALKVHVPQEAVPTEIKPQLFVPNATLPNNAQASPDRPVAAPVTGEVEVPEHIVPAVKYSGEKQSVTIIQSAANIPQSVNVQEVNRVADILPQENKIQIDATLGQASVVRSEGKQASTSVSYNTQSNIVIQDVLAKPQAAPAVVIVEKPHVEHSTAYKGDNPFTSAIVDVDGQVQDADVLINRYASRLTVKVIGEMPDGARVVQPELKNWPADKALIFGQTPDSEANFLKALSHGDVLSISFPMIDVDGVAEGAVSSSGATSSSSESTLTQVRFPSQIPLAMQVLPFVSSVADIFDGLADQMLGAVPLPQSGQAMIPSLAKPAEITASMLFLVAALRSGDVGQVFNEKMTESLQRLGKTEALEKLGQLASGKQALMSSKTEQGSSAGAEWKSIMLPMHADAQVSAIALHWQDHSANQEDGGDAKDDTARFILDFTLSSMGDVQLDGFYKNNQLDVALRLDKLPSEAMQGRISQFYMDALDKVNLAGNMRFQLVQENAVRFQLAE